MRQPNMHIQAAECGIHTQPISSSAATARGGRAIFILTKNAGDRRIAQLAEAGKSEDEIAEAVRKTLSRIRLERLTAVRRSISRWGTHFINVGGSLPGRGRSGCRGEFFKFSGTDPRRAVYHCQTAG